MLQPVTPPGSSPSSSTHPVEALFDVSWADLHPLLHDLLDAEPPDVVLDAAVQLWLDRRGSGGTTGVNALLTALSARQLGLMRGGEDAVAAAVAALGFFHHAAGTAPVRRELPRDDASETWQGWGDDALLAAGLGRWKGAVPDIDPALVRRACAALIARPKLRQVRGLLLAASVGRSEAARAHVQAFLDPSAPADEPELLDASQAGPEATEEAVHRACRLDPRPTLGHAMQVAAICEGLRDHPTVGVHTRLALAASAATWPRLQRHWTAFLASSSA
jgi:hypothetical protein